MITASILGGLIGLTLGLTGAGGGILAVPALVLILHYPMQEAGPIALVAVGLAAFIGALDGLRKKTVRYKAAILMALAGSLVTPLGIHLAGLLPASGLVALFSLVMFIVAARMYRQAVSTHANRPEQSDTKPCMLSDTTGRFIWTPLAGATLSGIGAVSGLFTGMLGVGGGFIIVPALKHFSNVSMHGIVSTSLMVITLISTSAVANAFMQGLRISTQSWAFIVCAIAGMAAGRLLAPKVPPRALQLAFATVSALVAIIMLLKTFLA
jgi:hypothetical protein